MSSNLYHLAYRMFPRRVYVAETVSDLAYHRGHRARKPLLLPAFHLAPRYRRLPLRHGYPCTSMVSCSRRNLVLLGYGRRGAQ